jgi:hypothetical protein
VGVLFDKYGFREDRDPLWIDGKESILEMKKNNSPSWKEVEWPGHYIKYLIQNFCIQNPGYNMSPFEDVKRHLVKGNFLWDVRVNDFKRSDTILGDVREYDRLTVSNNGVGVILVDAQILTDRTGNFRKWHDELKGGLSAFSKRREKEGRREQPRKEKILIKGIRAYFFQPGDLARGVTEGWAKDKFQRTMRNATVGTRNNKYQILKSKIPSGNILFLKNF